MNGNPCILECEGDTPHPDPIGGCTCISEDDHNMIVNHGLGLDCLPNTPDDDTNNVGDDDCPEGYTYDFDLCNCV